MAAPTRSSNSEDSYGEKWDRCVSDTLVKTASGLALGIVFSAVLFRRRPWPVFLGTGIGLGMGYSNCQNDFRAPFVPPQVLSIAKNEAQALTKPAGQ